MYRARCILLETGVARAVFKRGAECQISHAIAVEVRAACDCEAELVEELNAKEALTHASRDRLEVDVIAQAPVFPEEQIGRACAIRPARCV